MTLTLLQTHGRVLWVSLADGVAQIYVPIMFTTGAPGQEGQKTRFLMNQVLLKTPTGWRVATFFPFPPRRSDHPRRGIGQVMAKRRRISRAKVFVLRAKCHRTRRAYLSKSS